MGIKDFADKARDAMGGVRGKVGGAAEAAVDKIDDMTGGKVPEAVKAAVDKIDGDADETDGEVDGDADETDGEVDEEVDGEVDEEE